MRRYAFSGHLHPRPPGTERVMAALSGEVYLVRDVEQELRDRDIAYQRELAKRDAKIAKLIDKVARLKKKLAVGKERS